MNCPHCASLVPEDMELVGVCRACVARCVTVQGLRPLSEGEFILKGDKQMIWTPREGVFNHYPIQRQLRDAVRTVGMRWSPWMVPHYRRVA